MTEEDSHSRSKTIIMQKILCYIAAFDTNIITVIRINKIVYRKRKKIQSGNFNCNSWSFKLNSNGTFKCCS